MLTIPGSKANVTISGFTIQHGFAENGGGVTNFGTLAKVNSTLEGKEKQKSKSRVPVTALIARPTFIEAGWNGGLAAPAEMRTLNSHRA
ncbi:MAG TPA: hypothetical protein VF753_18065 [Terriglobales bacterium]